MILPHLLRISVENLAARAGRTLFLVLGVAVGTGTLAFLLSLSQGMREGIEANLETLRAVVARQDDLLGKKEALIETLPVRFLTVRPKAGRTERIGRDQLMALRRLPGVRRVSPVAFLFPVTVGIKGKNLGIFGSTEAFEKEMRIPTTVYGLEGAFLPKGDLLPGANFDSPPPKDAPEGRMPPIPVVLPAQWLDYLTTLKTEEMRHRFAEMAVAELTSRMERDPKFRQRVEAQARLLLGLATITEPLLKDAIEDALGEFLGQLDRENLAQAIDLTIYPGLGGEQAGLPAVVAGYSDSIPDTGLSVPLGYIERWNQQFQDETSNLLTRVLARETELAYSEVHIESEGIEQSLDLHERLVMLGYKVESQIDELRRLDRELKSLKDEGRRLTDETARSQRLGETLDDGTLVIAALLFLLAGTVIVYGLSLSVLEQQQRIGILRAVGARRLDILTIFLFEALVVGAAGSVLGVAAARLAVGELGARILAGFGAAGVPQADPALELLVIGLGAGFSVVAGYFPALKGAWIQPVEVLKG